MAILVSNVGFVGFVCFVGFVLDRVLEVAYGNRVKRFPKRQKSDRSAE
ncbi:MAG: hypothetical protein SW833_10010 [Cyanobacteriota bacterium]|nr:hypothetical protein [Cyanobacteriota bacterium]